jgi:tetratricopeptide (TPR) repeat protein
MGAFHHRSTADRSAPSKPAIADYSTALTLLPFNHPDRMDLLQRRASNYLKLKEYDNALADIRQYEELDPTYATLIRSRLSGMLIDRSTTSQQKDLPGALLDLRKAVQIDPKSSLGHNNLAWLLLTGPKEFRQANEALSHAQTAVALDENGGLHLNTLGVALYRTGRFGEALAILEKALELTKGQFDSFNLYFMAMCQAQLGDPIKAKVYFERAMTWMKEQKNLDPQYRAELKEFQSEAEELLRNLKRK